MWGGRFEADPSEVTRRFTYDDSDRRLLDVDIRGSIAHVRMLGQQGIVTPEESEALLRGLDEISNEVFEFHDTDEDVHSAVERRLGELVGSVAGKLHTGRSRNDQVATDLKLYVMDCCGDLARACEGFAHHLAELAEEHAGTAIPSYTHLQQAQVTSLGNHLLAYAFMSLRDAGRFDSCRQRSSFSSLGAGASAGSSLPLDRRATAAELGFDHVAWNTLDAVASRDFVSEMVFACAQTMVHLSRLAEEVVLWAGAEFSWLTLGDEVSTGSSALPHKRNPDIAELVRGRSAVVIGATTAILGLQKGLPLAYNRDLQEDKRILFQAIDFTRDAIEAMSELLAGVQFDPPPPDPSTQTLPLAEILVGRGIPFREAHDVVGRLVRTLESEGRTLADLGGDELHAHDDRFRAEDLPLEVRLPDLGPQLEMIRASTANPA